MDSRASVRVRPQAPVSPADGYLYTRADWRRQAIAGGEGPGALRAVNHDKPILAPLAGEFSWAKNRVILGRCKIDLAREFYLEALDSGHRLDGENPPIGIIICRGKEKAVVEYALRTATRPLGVATYTVVPQLPEDYRADLPSPEQIAERLRAWEELGGGN